MDFKCIQQKNIDKKTKKKRTSPNKKKEKKTRKLVQSTRKITQNMKMSAAWLNMFSVCNLLKNSLILPFF